MNCSYCGAENPNVALYCAECGEAFYRIEGWRRSHLFHDTRGSISAHLYIDNQGVGGIQPEKITSEDGTFQKKFTDTGAVFKGKEERRISFDAHEIMEVNGALRNLRAHFTRTRSSGPENSFSVPVPEITFSEHPEVKLRIEEGFLVGEDGKVENTPPGRDLEEENLIPLQLRVSTGYCIEGKVVVENDASAFITKTVLLTEEGDRVRKDTYSEAERVTSVSIPLPEETHESYGEPDEYVLSVEVTGADPIEVQFAPQYLHEPELQVLVERPTRAGWFFVGKSAMTANDLSRDRLKDDEPVRNLTDNQKEHLREDTLVHETWDQLEGNKSLLHWHVAEGIQREKRIAISRVHTGSDQKSAEDEKAEYDLVFSINGEEFNRGPFQARERRTVNLPLPPLHESTSGTLEVRIRGADESITLDVEIDVFQRRHLDVPVAVDFGTTNSCVALSLPEPKDGRYVTDVRPDTTFLVPLRQTDVAGSEGLVEQLDERLAISRIIPTRVHQSVDGSLGINPSERGDHAFEKFKVRLDRDEIFSTDQSEKESPEKLAEVFLSEVLNRTALFLEERRIPRCEVTPITCPLPTSFTFPEREAIDSAYARAQRPLIDSEDHRVQVDESMAAFRYQQLTELESSLEEFINTGAVLLVYDFGGGTTDVTSLYAHADRSNEVVAWSYTELAASGDSELGGEYVTERLADLLFGGTQAVDSQQEGIEVAEIVKRRLGAMEASRDPAREELQSALAGSKDVELTEREAAREIQRRMEEEIDLRVRCDEILADVFVKSRNRLLEILPDRPPKSVPVVVLLAGNASRLVGFPDLVEETARNQIETLDGTPLRMQRVTRMSEPKAAVAKGSFLSKGRVGDIDAPFRPHISYWLMLDPDVAGTPRKSYQKPDGTRFVRLASEGTRPHTEEIPLSQLGIHDTAPYKIYRRHGVVFRPLAEPVYLEVGDRKQHLHVQVDEEENVELQVVSNSS